MTDLQIAVVHPGRKLRHIEDATEVAMPGLTSYPRLSTRLIAATIKHKDGGTSVLHLDIEDKVRVLLIHRAAALLPFRFDDEVIRPTLRMISDKVTVLRGSVDTCANMKVLRVNGLPQNAGRSEAGTRNECVPMTLKMRQDKPFQYGSRVIGLCAA